MKFKHKNISYKILKKDENVCVSGASTIEEVKEVLKLFKELNIPVIVKECRIINVEID